MHKHTGTEHNQLRTLLVFVSIQWSSPIRSVKENDETALHIQWIQEHELIFLKYHTKTPFLVITPCHKLQFTYFTKQKTHNRTQKQNNLNTCNCVVIIFYFIPTLIPSHEFPENKRTKFHSKFIQNCSVILISVWSESCMLAPTNVRISEPPNPNIFAPV